MEPRERLVSTLADLVRINSINPEWGGPGEGEVVAYQKRFFSEAGIEFWEDEVLPGRSNLYAKIPGREASGAVLLEAHMDVVSVEGMTIPPFDPVVKDGALFGRGSCDTKGGLAAMVEALKYLRESNLTPPVDIWFAAVVDEEHAFRGVLAAIDWFRNRGVSISSSIVAEPTKLALVRANKGVLRWRMETIGKAAHSSKPHLGVNAISLMAQLITQLDQHHESLAEIQHPLLGPATCNIGIIQGGDQVNFVPDKCTIALDRRMLPREAEEAILAGYEEIVARFPEGSVRIIPPDLCDAAMETPEDSRIVQIAREGLVSLGLPGESVGVPFGCDATKLSRAGIPSIIFGPGSIDQAHAAVEWVDVNELQLAFDFYCRFLMNYCP